MRARGAEDIPKIDGEAPYGAESRPRAGDPRPDDRADPAAGSPGRSVGGGSVPALSVAGGSQADRERARPRAGRGEAVATGCPSGPRRGRRASGIATPAVGLADTLSDRKPDRNSLRGSRIDVTSTKKATWDGTRVALSGGGGNCTRVPRSVDDGLYVRIRSFDCRPRGPGRQGPLRLIPS
jgi:hypothetical protein